MIRIKRYIQQLSKAQWLYDEKLSDWDVRRAVYQTPGKYEWRGDSVQQSLDTLDGCYGTTYFISRRIPIPASWNGEKIGLLIQGGGEGLLRLNGKSLHGVDRNHGFVPFTPKTAEEIMDVEIELYDPIPEPIDPLNYQQVRNEPVRSLEIRLVIAQREIQSLLYRMTVIADAAQQLPEGDTSRIRLLHALQAAVETAGPIDTIDPSRAAAAEQLLIETAKLSAIDEQWSGTMHMVGQSHIDIAWLWPVRETVRKASRTFSTMCSLMDEYPDFRYAQSQPQLYQFVKDNDPELYERVKARVAEGRWEIVGGMWVEPDLNIPNGESLARQLLYGQRFFKEEFGLLSTIEWLPDTFGYCASLPQLLKLAGINRFMTSKLYWNDTNMFPHDLFHWVGIDGTAVLSFLNHGINEHTLAKDIHEHWQSFRQKEQVRDQMLLYGHGDGGGGVTREMVEYIERSEHLPGVPAVRFSTAERFFEQVEQHTPKLPKWYGDLYLELHRGTYTTHAQNKWNNRKAEILYREAELWLSLSRSMDPSIRKTLHDGWKLLLLNQFHDIIPGTSIPEVYETSAKEYEAIFEHGNQVLDHALAIHAKNVKFEGEGCPYLVFNSLGWDRSELVRIHGGAELLHTEAFDLSGNKLSADVMADEEKEQGYVLLVQVPSVPAFGHSTIWLREGANKVKDLASAKKLGDSWENPWHAIQFNDDGEIVSWVDKTAGRELVPTGTVVNELQLFRDEPTYWDAWDIDPKFADQRAGKAKLLEKTIELSGTVCDVLYFRWELGESIIDQRMIMYHNRKTVDFVTRVDWKEEHKVLKVAFPVDIVASKATYEIPFGAIERPTHDNTSWEKAQFEVCGHRWADVSEAGYGASLLNDSKYGYDIKEGTLRLSLLRAPRWPDDGADKGVHQFTYSFFPHEGDWRQGEVVHRAAELNQPLMVTAGESSQEGILPMQNRFMNFNGTNVVVETVKPAEDGEGIVFRLYESGGGTERIHLDLPDGVTEAIETDLLEYQGEQLSITNGRLELKFKPFEIKTILCRFNS